MQKKKKNVSKSWIAQYFPSGYFGGLNVFLKKIFECSSGMRLCLSNKINHCDRIKDKKKLFKYSSIEYPH